MAIDILAVGRTTRNMASDRMSMPMEPHIWVSGVKTKNMALVKQGSKAEIFMKETIISGQSTEKESLYIKLEQCTKDTLLIIR